MFSVAVRRCGLGGRSHRAREGREGALREHRAYRMGVDIGGTFTDFALFDAGRGSMAIHKQLTTPADPSMA